MRGRVQVRQSGRAAAGEITNDRPAELSIQWFDADGNNVDPTDVIWTMDVAGMGNIDPDGLDPHHKALYSPNMGVTGPISFGAESIQIGLSNFQAEPAEVEQVDPLPPPSAQIVEGAVQINQAAAVSVRASSRRR